MAFAAADGEDSLLSSDEIDSFVADVVPEEVEDGRTMDEVIRDAGTAAGKRKRRKITSRLKASKWSAVPLPY